MNRKSARIAALIEDCQGQALEAHYLGYFACFNRQLFYEAHDVLEELWLAARRRPEGSFYKGLIQFAGAFVHLQKQRLHPAASLFQLARLNLQPYSPVHEHLDVTKILALIEDWLGRLEGDQYAKNPLTETNAPQLALF